jgi:hypothetical protein
VTIETVICLTEVVELEELTIAEAPVVRTAVVTNPLETARFAFTRRIRLYLRELLQPFALKHTGHGTFVNVPELPTILDKEIAGIDVTVVFDYQVKSAAYRVQLT